MSGGAKGTGAWFASGGGIAKSGPYDSAEEAREAFRLTDRALEDQRRKHGTEYPFAIDLRVWSET